MLWIPCQEHPKPLKKWENCVHPQTPGFLDGQNHVLMVLLVLNQAKGGSLLTKVSVARLLLDFGAHKDPARSDDATTPLHVAAYEGHLELLGLLLQAGADKDATMTDDGATPLYLAAQNGQEQVAKLLLEAGAKIDKADDDGMTPLHAAASQNQVKLVQLLLDFGAQKSLKRKEDGKTAIQLAYEKGHSNVVHLLETFQHLKRMRLDLKTVPFLSCFQVCWGPAFLLLFNYTSGSKSIQRTSFWDLHFSRLAKPGVASPALRCFLVKKRVLFGFLPGESAPSPLRLLRSWGGFLHALAIRAFWGWLHALLLYCSLFGYTPTTVVYSYYHPLQDISYTMANLEVHYKPPKPTTWGGVQALIS